MTRLIFPLQGFNHYITHQKAILKNFQAPIKFQYPYFNINPIIPILLPEKLFSIAVKFTRNWRIYWGKKNEEKKKEKYVSSFFQLKGAKMMGSM